jgi:hypothetical protein
LRVVSFAVVAAIVIIVGAVYAYYTYSASLVQTETKKTTVTETSLKSWKADGVIDEGEYSNQLSLALGNLVVYWKNDQTYLYVALSAKTMSWVAIGFDPSIGMKDADMIQGLVEEGKATVLDLHSTGVYGPHPEDEELGGTDDIVSSGGKEENGFTTIEFNRRLDTGDKYDKPLSKGEVSFIWSMSDADSTSVKHSSTTRGYGKLVIN